MFYSTTSISTFNVPALVEPIEVNAALLKSNKRDFVCGPLSFIFTTTDFPLLVLVTLTFVPNGKVLCAAVKLFLLYNSPLEVFLP